MKVNPFFILLLVFSWIPNEANATASNLNPRVRVHGGAIFSQSPAPTALTFGVDSRASRFIYLDIGGFLSPFALPGDEVNAESLSQTHLARHGIYAMPGIRIPHRQPKAFSWDINFRTGFGILWTDYIGEKTNNSYGSQPIEADVMTAAGIDLGIRRGELGVRLATRLLFAWPHDHDEKTDPLLIAPQLSVEGLYQF